MNRISLAGALSWPLWFIALAALGANSVNFPGKVSEINSPDGLYSIKNVDKPSKPTEVIRHDLLFLRKGHKNSIYLVDYQRNVDVLWSPDSKAFVVNFWFGSNLSSSSLYRVDDLTHPVEIEPKLDRKDEHSLAESQHIYTFVSRWISPSSLEVKVAGHNGEPFTLTYYWDLKTSFKRIKREAKEDTSRTFCQ